MSMDFTPDFIKETMGLMSLFGKDVEEGGALTIVGEVVAAVELVVGPLDEMDEDDAAAGDEGVAVHDFTATAAAGDPSCALSGIVDEDRISEKVKLSQALTKASGVCDLPMPMMKRPSSLMR
jgi:hypothetical protein